MFTSLRRMTRYAPIRVLGQTSTKSFGVAAGSSNVDNLDENGEPRFLENVQMFL